MGKNSVVDKVIVTFSIVLILSGIYINRFASSFFNQRDANSMIGKIEAGDGQRKSKNEIAWVGIGDKQSVYNEDVIFSGNEKMLLRLKDSDTSIHLQENTMLYLSSVDGELNLNVASGELNIATTKKAPPIRLKIDNEEYKIKLDKKSDINIDSNTKSLKSSKGKVKVSSNSGRIITLSKKAVALSKNKVLPQSYERISTSSQVLKNVVNIMNSTVDPMASRFVKVTSGTSFVEASSNLSFNNTIKIPVKNGRIETDRLPSGRFYIRNEGQSDTYQRVIKSDYKVKSVAKKISALKGEKTILKWDGRKDLKYQVAIKNNNGQEVLRKVVKGNSIPIKVLNTTDVTVSIRPDLIDAKEVVAVTRIEALPSLMFKERVKKESHNRISDELIVTKAQGAKVSAVIKDLNGKIVRSISNVKQSVGSQGLKPGLYTVDFLSKDGVVIHKEKISTLEKIKVESDFRIVGKEIVAKVKLPRKKNEKYLVSIVDEKGQVLKQISTRGGLSQLTLPLVTGASLVVSSAEKTMAISHIPIVASQKIQLTNIKKMSTNEVESIRINIKKNGYSKKVDAVVKNSQGDVVKRVADVNKYFTLVSPEVGKYTVDFLDPSTKEVVGLHTFVHTAAISSASKVISSLANEGLTTLSWNAPVKNGKFLVSVTDQSGKQLLNKEVSTKSVKVNVASADKVILSVKPVGNPNLKSLNQVVTIVDPKTIAQPISIKNVTKFKNNGVENIKVNVDKSKFKKKVKLVVKDTNGKTVKEVSDLSNSFVIESPEAGKYSMQFFDSVTNKLVALHSLTHTGAISAASTLIANTASGGLTKISWSAPVTNGAFQVALRDQSGKILINKQVVGKSLDVKLPDTSSVKLSVKPIGNTNIKPLNKTIDVIKDNQRVKIAKVQKFKLSGKDAVRVYIDKTNYPDTIKAVVRAKDGKVIKSVGKVNKYFTLVEPEAGRYTVDFLNTKTGKVVASQGLSYIGKVTAASSLVSNSALGGLTNISWKAPIKSGEYLVKISDTAGRELISKKVKGNNIDVKLPKVSKVKLDIKPIGTSDVMPLSKDVRVSQYELDKALVVKPKVIMKYKKLRSGICHEFSLPLVSMSKGYYVEIYKDKDLSETVLKTDKLSGNKFCWQGDHHGRFFYRYRFEDKWGKLSKFSPVGEVIFPISPTTEF